MNSSGVSHSFKEITSPLPLSSFARRSRRSIRHSSKTSIGLTSPLSHTLPLCVSADSLNSESDSKVQTLTKTIESLKAQCNQLSSLLQEDEQQTSHLRTQAKELDLMKRELQNAVERASTAERRKRELASELLAQRTKNELTIRDLEGKVPNYSSHITVSLPLNF